MRISYFPGDEYHTPANKRTIWDKSFLGTRFYFLFKYFQILNTNRKKALKGNYGTQAWAASSLDILRISESCGAQYHITGLDNLHNVEGPVIFVSNHMSTLETMVYPAIIGCELETTFVVKESLLSAPIFAPVMKSRKPITVKRENVRDDLMAVMTQGQQKLKEGSSIIIFPQSTRTVNFDPKEFNSMGIKLAKKGKVQVVPIALKSDFWANGKWVKELGPIHRKKHVHIEFGEPFFVTGTGKEDHTRVTQWIVERLNKWQKK